MCIRDRVYAKRPESIELHGHFNNFFNTKSKAPILLQFMTLTTSLGLRDVQSGHVKMKSDGVGG